MDAQHTASRGGGRPFRRSVKKSAPITAAQRFGTSRYLASALLRRPGLWERLAGHQFLAITSHESDHGLDWHAQRALAPGHPVHDDRLADVLAGPDLIMDERTHECLPTACSMRFIPRSNNEGWDGILTVTTTCAESDTSIPSVRRARHFAVLGESQTVDNPRIANSHLSLPRVKGRVLQLDGPPVSRYPYTPWHFARHLGAAWALQGDRVLIIRSVFSTMAGWSRDPFSAWPSANRPAAPAVHAPWQRMRLVPGSRALYVYGAAHGLDALRDLVSRARDHFDWVILADSIDHHMCPAFLDDIADDYLLVTGDSGYRTSLSVSHPRHGASAKGGIPLTPSEAAVLWREQTLHFVPLDRIPVAGLLVVTGLNDTKLPDAFAAEADHTLARLGTPILGRIHSNVIADRCTVLDQTPDQTDRAFIAEAAAVAARLKDTDCFSFLMPTSATAHSV
ncbi:hypothetical protein OG426_44335 [Streptomyces canus]|uniref:hypothetical protein n=1 Tax=Streptomyces canus TaxID=58343 RepID=UPI002251C14F|nr:hypothetical protein [Streptomyces canus]MCX4855664.1 hypothetical protein [Streptomyces canus]WSW38967.1 hypothetical protein OG426_44335 [Streptomyces canus]